MLHVSFNTGIKFPWKIKPRKNGVAGAKRRVKSQPLPMCHDKRGSHDSDGNNGGAKVESARRQLGPAKPI
ncbi:hypothetical protein X777_01076 [Ooceraea biroi]|uniref:Uncharacterized protein n=1 Tax=Ooceraea biroi TaxID=2015173 RepID=A0A026WR50_OOCBI|nr:hypothetical protein X777_01076 [Ooceraea biroi]